MISIGSPCGKRWDQMPGDERRRYCGECGKFVHSAEAYSESELAAMGPFCVYLPGETAGPAQSRRAVMAGTLLTAIAPLLAQNGRVRIVVTDATGEVVPAVDVTIDGRVAPTDSTGTASFTGLAAGRHAVTASASGFTH